MLAVPPIQLPLRAASCCQVSGESISRPTSRNAIGAPITMPRVPTSSMMIASRPMLKIALRSMVSIRRNSAIGSRMVPMTS